MCCSLSPLRQPRESTCDPCVQVDKCLKEKSLSVRKWSGRMWTVREWHRGKGRQTDTQKERDHTTPHPPHHAVTADDERHATHVRDLLVARHRSDLVTGHLPPSNICPWYLKVKCVMSHKKYRRRVHLFFNPWANHWSLWGMASATTDLLSHNPTP